MRWTPLVVVLALSACADASTASAPPSEASAGAVLDVTCDGSRTSITGSAVQAQSDGVHVRVENTTSDRLAFDWDGGGDNADPGRTSLVLAVPPGTG